VGFYTQEADQGNLTFGSALFGGGIRPRTLTRNIWREMLKQTIFDISPEKRQPVCRCHYISDRKGRTKDVIEYFKGNTMITLQDKEI